MVSNERSKEINSIMEKITFNTETLKKNKEYPRVEFKTFDKKPKYSTAIVSFKEYFIYLIIWHEQILTAQDYLNLYNATEAYTPSAHTKHDDKKIKKFENLILCKPLDKIEKYEQQTTKKLKYYYCEVNSIIKNI
ncbi:21551_t:CDS:1, partial [Gigaspora margarita]